ncbi:phosphoadenosine phosphosulfate reductase family protein [Alphaproteobacteria bacterium]|nr:phosphoadenosine phosphosulfate reductase family protein [Alphaproteobacteria bacterium]
MTTNVHKTVLGLSGGKDSSALAIFMKEKEPDTDVEYFFTDTGKELPEVYEFLDKMQSNFGINVHYLTPNTGNTDESAFDYFHKINNYYLPSAQARWCTVNLKLKPFEKWIKPTLEQGGSITSLVAIRADEDREGYRPSNERVKVRFPFIEYGIDKQGVRNILEKSGLGMPEYYKWRSRSGCTFCFYQQKIEWVNLKEKYPDKFDEAKSYEKLSKDHDSPFTWTQGESLDQLEKPQRIEKIKKDFADRKRKELAKKKFHPILGKLEEYDDEFMESDVSHSCVICHK